MSDTGARLIALTLFLCSIVLLAGSPAVAGDKAAAPSGAAGLTPYVTISSAGPLEEVFLGNELSAQIAYTGDTDYQVFPPSVIPGDYGTFIATGGTLYAPDFGSHGGTATFGLGSYTPFTPVSQSAVSGSGTVADPYTVVTVVDAGATSLRLTQTDSYVVGEESYRTDVMIANMGTANLSLIFYRAMDCYLGGSDVGYGYYDAASGAIACSVNAGNDPADRIEQLLPLTPGSTYYEDFFADIWTHISTHTAFPSTCECGVDQDNGAGLSWSLTIPAGGDTTISHLTTFSPVGNLPLSTVKSADSPTSSPGDTNGYTITISNPNLVDVALDEIFDTLPAGFSYVAGSSSGVTASDPAISGSTLTWAGPFTVPSGGSVMLHFEVLVSMTPGTYYNEAGGSSVDYTVAPTGPTAPITVEATTDVTLSGISGATGINLVTVAGVSLLIVALCAGFATTRRCR